MEIALDFLLLGQNECMYNICLFLANFFFEVSIKNKKYFDVDVPVEDLIIQIMKKWILKFINRWFNDKAYLLQLAFLFV